MPKVKEIRSGLLLVLGLSLLALVLASCTDNEQIATPEPIVADNTLVVTAPSQTVKEVAPTSQPPATTRATPTTILEEPIQESKEPVAEPPSTTLPEEPVVEVPPTTLPEEPIQEPEEPVAEPPSTTLPEEPVVEVPPTTVPEEPQEPEEPVVEPPSTTTQPLEEPEEPVVEPTPTTTQPPEEKLLDPADTDECLKTYYCTPREAIQLENGEMGCVNPEVWQYRPAYFRTETEEGFVWEILDICCPEGWIKGRDSPTQVGCSRY